MSDLGQHLWETACAITKAHAEELRCPQAITTKADTLQGSSTAQSAAPLYPGCAPDKQCVHGNPWGGECPHCNGKNDLGPTIAKAPLRAELRRLEMFAKIYREQALQHEGEAMRLRVLATQADECAENLKAMGDL